MQLGAGSLISANLKMQVYLLKAIRLPSPARGRSVPSDAPRKGTYLELDGRRGVGNFATRTGGDAHGLLRGRGVVPQLQQLSSPRCEDFQQLSSAGTLRYARTGLLSAVGTNGVSTEQT